MITVDDREPQSIDKRMEDIGLEFKRKRMKTGDFVEGDVCIERKTVNDFCGSIVDGRLDRQIENMKRDYKHYYILISGSIKARKSELTVNSILGKMSSVLVKHQVPIVSVDNDEQLIYLVGRIFLRHQEKKEAENEEILS